MPLSFRTFSKVPIAGLSEIWTWPPLSSTYSTTPLTTRGWVSIARDGGAGPRKLGLMSTRQPLSMAAPPILSIISDSCGLRDG